jgi:hypothetical protein
VSGSTGRIPEATLQTSSDKHGNQTDRAIHAPCRRTSHRRGASASQAVNAEQTRQAQHWSGARAQFGGRMRGRLARPNGERDHALHEQARAVTGGGETKLVPGTQASSRAQTTRYWRHTCTLTRVSSLAACARLACLNSHRKSPCFSAASCICRSTKNAALRAHQAGNTSEHVERCNARRDTGAGSEQARR